MDRLPHQAHNWPDSNIAEQVYHSSAAPEWMNTINITIIIWNLPLTASKLSISTNYIPPELIQILTFHIVITFKYKPIN